MAPSKGLNDKIREQFVKDVIGLVREDRYEEALSRCNQYIATSNNKGVGYKSRAYVNRSAGNQSAAYDDLKHAIENSTDNRSNLVSLARWLIEDGKYQEGYDAALKLVKLDEEAQSIYFVDFGLMIAAYAAWRVGWQSDARTLLHMIKDEGSMWIDGKLISKEFLIDRLKEE